MYLWLPFSISVFLQEFNKLLLIFYKWNQLIVHKLKDYIYIEEMPHPRSSVTLSYAFSDSLGTLTPSADISVALKPSMFR